MGVRAGVLGGQQPPPQKKKLCSSFFWAMTKIWAEGVFGVSNIALTHIERAHANFVIENEMERILIFSVVALVETVIYSSLIE